MTNKPTKKEALREKTYEILKVNDATNEASWWNIADEIVETINKEVKEIFGRITEALQQSFEIDYIEQDGKKYVNANQAQKQVVKVFRKIKKELEEK